VSSGFLMKVLIMRMRERNPIQTVLVKVCFY